MTSRKYALRRRVVLDGPLIVHGGVGGEGVDGRRLASAFQCYEKLGYSVEATISKSKYREFIKGIYYDKVGNKWVKKEKKPIVGAASIKRLFADGKLFKFQGDDDKVMLDKCLEKGKEAWIVSHDKFDDIRRDGKVTKRQRSKYPNLDWDEIDEFTRGTINRNGRIISNKHWYVEGKDFYDHEMPPAPPRILFGKFSKIRALSNDLTLLLSDIDGVLEDLGEKPTDNKSSMRTRIKKMQFQATSFINLIPKDEFGLEEVSALIVPDLRRLAKARGLSGYSKLKKKELIDLIMKDTPENTGVEEAKTQNKNKQEPKSSVKVPKKAAPKKPRKRKQSKEIVNKFIQVLEREIYTFGEAEFSFSDILHLAKEVKDEYGIAWSGFLDCFNAKGLKRLDDRVRALLSHIQIEYEERKRDGIHYAIFQ